MESIFNWFQNNWQEVLLIINSAVLLADRIVKLTRTQTDDNWLLKVKDFLKRIFLYK